MSTTPNQAKRIAALNRSYRAGREEAFYDVADWLGLVESEDDEPTEEDVKARLRTLIEGTPAGAKNRAADLLCAMHERDLDGGPLFEHVLDRDDLSLRDAADEGYPADEIASLALDGAPDPTEEK